MQASWHTKGNEDFMQFPQNYLSHSLSLSIPLTLRLKNSQVIKFNNTSIQSQQKN